GPSISIASPPPPPPPQLGIVTPASSSGNANQAKTFSITATDPNGWASNNEVDLLFSLSTWNPQNACLIAFIPVDPAGPRLFSDDLTTLTSLGSGPSVSNTHCQLNAAGFSNSYGGSGGTTLTLNYSVQFSPKAVGYNYVVEQVSDQWATTGWNVL